MSSENINQADKNGKTLAIHAAENMNLAALITTTLAHSQQPIFPELKSLQYLKPGKLDLNQQDNLGNTALTALSRNNDRAISFTFWEKLRLRTFGPFVSRFSKVPNLQKLLKYDHPVSQTALMLLKAGADPALPNHRGETALMLAARSGNLSMLRVLCDSPDIALLLKQQDRKKQTALQVAMHHHQFKAAKLLRAAEEKTKANHSVAFALKNMNQSLQAAAFPHTRITPF